MLRAGYPTLTPPSFFGGGGGTFAQCSVQLPGVCSPSMVWQILTSNGKVNSYLSVLLICSKRRLQVSVVFTSKFSKLHTIVLSTQLPNSYSHLTISIQLGRHYFLVSIKFQLGMNLYDDEFPVKSLVSG